MDKISSIFGSMVFNDTVMKERLPKDTYKALKKNMEEGTNLTLEVASIVANAMKNWALEKGATHFTHWFQPMTGITAEKHDSFLTPSADGGVIMEFSGKELIKGEPDASSFPSGGIRATFEARGYTNWDPSSFAFIKENTLCIPTAFCSYRGEALDKKTPLLRSMEALNVQALRILKLFGQYEVKRVVSTIGAEQEYFLINKDLFDMRKDLIYCGRTLFGAKPPKNQELDDHYFGAIKPRVNAYMEELDEELWKLGIYVKTEHNEVAPSQHELAPVFTTSNIATDHNQLTMEIMKKVAANHGLVCLLHEKPFAGVNGSGKHVNWSISTDGGENLLTPGKNPSGNLRFLLFLCAVIKAVDEYQDLLRVSVASAGNDHRLGGNEAPPAIISMFIGEDLENILTAFEKGEVYTETQDRTMNIGVSLPQFKRDTTDRNRTSPFAFTGNKFEFRMPGSGASISCPSYMLNVTVAESLRQFADILESSKDMETGVKALIKETVTKHKRIIFNGNNYSEEWVSMAENRGLLNLKSAVDALPHYSKEKNLELFRKHTIFTEVEVRARQEILLREYCNILNIEALAMTDMVNKDILPAVSGYIKSLTDTALGKKALSADITCELEIELISNLSSISLSLHNSVQELDNALIEVNAIEDLFGTAEYYNQRVLPIMKEIRIAADTMETMTASNSWPFPAYGELLFSV